jgi:membrane protease YdiL (CAAX protease family)
MNAAAGLMLTELLFFALPAAVFLRRHRAELGRRAFAPPHPSILLWVGFVAICVIASAVGGGVSLRRALGIYPPNQNLPFILIPVICFVAPACEELLFRPVIQRVLSYYWSPGSAVLATALWFGLMHSSWLRFGETFVLGLFAGLVYLKTSNYWACVVFHVVCNLAGPFLFGHSDRLEWLFHPGFSVALLLMALAGVSRVNPRLTVPPTRIRQYLREWLFNGHFLPPRRASHPMMAVAYWAWVVFLAGVLSAWWPQELDLHRRSGSFPSAGQTERWTVQRGGLIRAHSRLEYKAWPEKWPRLLDLPYGEARPLVVKIGGVAAEWRLNAPERIQLISPTNFLETVEKTIEIIWEVPLTALATDNTYRARLWPLVAVDHYSLTLALAPECGFAFLKNPQATEELLVDLTFNGLPRDTELGYCRLGIRRTSVQTGQ